LISFNLSAPFISQYSNPIVPIILAILLFFSVSNYLFCAFSDPGFLPRAQAQEVIKLEKDNSKSDFLCLKVNFIILLLLLKI
jgi:hypothetical protein